jgi:hypothetical protein
MKDLMREREKRDRKWAFGFFVAASLWPLVWHFIFLKNSGN